LVAAESPRRKRTGTQSRSAGGAVARRQAGGERPAKRTSTGTKRVGPDARPRRIRPAEPPEETTEVPDSLSEEDSLELEEEDANYDMPESGVVPPGRGNADGMHTLDGNAARPVSRNLDPSQLYRGRARLALLRDLALGEWSDASIAQSVGVPTEIISDFRLTYSQEISEVRAALAGKLAIESAGLWISKRQNRLAELQQDYEDIDLVIDVMRENVDQLKHVSGADDIKSGDRFDMNMLLGSRRHQNLLRAKISILKAVSDELTSRQGTKDRAADEEAESRTVRYVITQEGGDDIIGSLT